MTEILNNFPKTLAEFEEFIITHQDKLVRHAFFMLGSFQEAEDIVQNTLIRIYQDRFRYTNINNPVSYTFRMVSNACVDNLRRETRVPIVSLNGSAEAHSKTGVSREGEIIREEEFMRINKLLGSIPPEQAEVIRLKVIDELSFVEIAASMEIPVTTVKSRFKYGLEKLKSQLLPGEEVRK